LKYIVFDERDIKFQSANVKTVEKLRQLTATGFGYVYTYKEVMLFRKRK
jgi:hypothetical protein